MARETLKEELCIERYRYILTQLSASNEAMYRLLRFYQAAVAAVLAAVGVVIGASGTTLPRPIMLLAVDGGFTVVAMLTGFLAIQLFANCYAWFDYRHEECALFNSVGLSDRKAPQWRHFWRWPEFYLLLFGLLFGVAALIALRHCRNLL